jgi:FMN-dependent NADH-azoreductase
MNILYIKSSITGDASQTNQLLDAIRERFVVKHPQAQHVVRDLAQESLPHLAGQHLAAAPAEGQQALAELQAADVVVIGAPMYNFSIPSTLKAWIDHIAKSGVTFKYTEQGPVGMLTGKRAVVLVSSGGVYSDGPYAGADFVAPYLKTVLGFVGITDVTFIRAEGAGIGASTMTAALDQVAEL